MLLRFDPFRDAERFSEQAWTALQGRPVMPIDAYRRGDEFLLHVDLPGVAPESIDLTVEKHVLTITAERPPAAREGDQVVAGERPVGRFSRQLNLGESLDAGQVRAQYEDGVLTVTVPVAEQAKPRRVAVHSAAGRGRAIEAEATEGGTAAA